ncbi:MAG: Gfo/Idh/MocA family protein, partial [Planctomycetota bacterium]
MPASLCLEFTPARTIRYAWRWSVAADAAAGRSAMRYVQRRGRQSSSLWRTFSRTSRKDRPERRFLGFDAYRRAIDCLRPGDVMIQATHSAFRPMHVEYAIEKGVNVFMEKSFAPDPGGTRRILHLAEAAEKKNLKIGCGLMCRHSASRQALIQKIRDGAMGDITLVRAYRMDPGARMGPFKGGQSELMWQIRRPYFFLWVSSAWFIEMMIHQVDECCWIK